MAIPQILQQLGGGQGLTISPQIKQMIQMVRSANNPQAMINQLMQTNPQMKQVMDVVRASGNDPKKAFYALAQQKGINPDDILNQLK